MGIDDPLTWMNSVPPAIVDLWLAYFTLEKESGKESEKMDPSEVLNRLIG